MHNIVETHASGEVFVCTLPELRDAIYVTSYLQDRHSDRSYYIVDPKLSSRTELS